MSDTTDDEIAEYSAWLKEWQAKHPERVSLMKILQDKNRQLLADNAALREELEQVKAEKNENACRYLNAISERNQLQRDQDFIVDLFKAGIEVLDKALRFYTDKKGYQPTGWQGDQSPSVVIKDEGNTARQVLEKYDLLEPK